jgi:hypothetical protein
LSEYPEISAAEEYAWAGAVLESKGYANYKTRKMLRLTDDRECLLERFAEIVGAGRVFSEWMPTREKFRYRWELYSPDDIEAVVGLLEPYLSREALSRFTLANAEAQR